LIHREFLTVSQLHGMLIRLPLLRLGAGRPRLVLVANVHGDEQSGLIVLWRLYQHLLENPLQRGEVVLLPVANPPAFATGQRASPIDGQDLNRTFPGARNQTITERTAQTLLELLRESDFVVDIHDLPDMLSPTVGLIMSTADEENLLRSWRGLAAFAPEAAWEITRYHRYEMKQGLPLCVALNSEHMLPRGVPNFALELPHPPRLGEEEQRVAVIGLHNLMSHLGFGLSRLASPHRTTVYTHSKVVARDYGLFIPAQRPIVRLQTGEQVGTFVFPATFEEEAIVAPQNGLLIQVGAPGLVSPGQPLIRIGQVEQAWTASIQEWQHHLLESTPCQT
jgi:predicted deacylase